MAETRKEMMMRQLIAQAKERVEKSVQEPPLPKRVWGRAVIPAVMTSEWDVELHVLLGTPARGYVVANFGSGRILAFSSYDELLETYSTEGQ